MSLPRIVDLFSKFENVPVDLYEVRDAILETGVVDEINFVAANLNPDVLKGIFRRYRNTSKKIPAPYALNEIRHDVRIYYANTMSYEWARLVCCKEMMHIYDVTEAHSLTESDIKFLIESLAFRQFVPVPASEDQHALKAEACALLFALHLLAPEAALEELRPDYESAKTTDIEIAKMLEIPPEYIDFLFSDFYKRRITQCLEAVDGSNFHPKLAVAAKG